MKRRVGLVAMVAVALAVSVRAEEGEKLPFEISKETTVVVSPLREDGTVDYAGAVNEKYKVRPEDNAFVAWLGIVGTGSEIFGRGRERRWRCAG